MAGLVFLTDFFGWTAQEAAEAYIFHTDIQYALNLEPGVAVSTRTVERSQSWATRSTPVTRTSRRRRRGAWTWSVRSPAARRRPTPRR